MELYLGIGVFVALFFAWVVLPPIIKKRHAISEELVEEDLND